MSYTINAATNLTYTYIRHKNTLMSYISAFFLMIHIIYYCLCLLTNKQLAKKELTFEVFSKLVYANQRKQAGFNCNAY